MNLKKINQSQTKKVMDALAKHPGKKDDKEGAILEKIAKTLSKRRSAEDNSSSEEEELK